MHQTGLYQQHIQVVPAVAFSARLLTVELQVLSQLFYVGRMALGQVFFPPVLQLFPVSIIPQMLHTRSFTYNRRYVGRFSPFL